MNKKKKFFDTKLGMILKGAAQIAAPNLVKVLDGSTTPQEALELIRSAPNVPQEEKYKLEMILLEHESELTKRLESDNAQELWLPKLIRPLTLVILVLTYVIGFFLEYDVSVLHAPIMTVFGFYFGGRTIEKALNKHV